MTDMRTALNKVRGLGSAKEGLHHFWLIRVTAVANIFLVSLSLIFFMVTYKSTYEEVHSFFSNPCVASVLFLTFLSVLYHMYLGMQVVIGDYIHNFYIKLFCFLLNTFFVFSLGVFLAFSLFKIVCGV